MKTCLVIRHVAFEDLGTFAPVAAEAGLAVTCRQAGVDSVGTEDWLACDLAVVLGGPIGVNDVETYPFIARERELVAARLAKGRPVLGICLGAQLMASALGARVYRGTREIGWAPVEVGMGGADSPLRHLAGVPVLHWHGDTFDLPEGAKRLASTAATPNQAFAVGAGLALQFHPEADAARLETWLIGHCCELGMAGLDPRVIRADAARYGEAVRAAGQAMFREWLADVLG
ncbi:MAG: glutamine amidotransferase [Desulfovibrionaceae bacterium]|nr:glutamine amidotransferase [Desulfovibrionaceae bacterium]